MLSKTIETTFSRKNLILYGILFLSLFLLYLLIDYNLFDLSFDNLVYIFILSFIIFFSITFFNKKIVLETKRKKIQQELPFFLNNLATDLAKNIPLKIALESRCDETEIGKLIKEALYSVKNHGFNLQDALFSVSSSYPELERVFYQIEDIMDSGVKNKEYSLKTLSDTIFENQTQMVRRFSTKLNLLTLLFIVFSAIIPSMFLMFLLVGSNFLELSFSPVTIVFVTIVLFPLIDMLLLLVIRSNNPL